MLRIKSVELVNFRSYEKARMPLAPLTYIVGPNGSGKSTFADAIAYGLTGQCRGLDGLSREIAELIRLQDGTHKGLGVRLEVENVGVVQRQTDGQKTFLKVADWTGSNKEQQGALFEYLETTPDVLAACLDSEAFTALHHSEAKNLIMGVLNVRIPAEPLAPFDIPGPLSLVELDRHYKTAFERRTIAKRDYDAARIAAMPEGDEPPPLSDLEAALAEVRDQERALLADGAEARGRVVELRKEDDRLRRELQTLVDRIGRLGDPHAALDAAEARLAAHLRAEPTIDRPAEQTADTLQAEAEAEREEVDSLRVRLADERGRLRLLSDTIGGIETHDPAKGCVLDSAIPCQTPVKEFAGKVKAIKTEIKKLGKSIEETTARLDLLEAQANTRRDADRKARETEVAARVAVEGWRTARMALDREIVGLTSRIADLQRDQERQADILARRSAIQTEIANVGAVDDQPSGVDEVRARIARGERIIAEAKAWNAARDRHLADEQKYAHLKAEVARLEALCTALGPHGLMVDAIEAARYRFEDKVNAALAKWGYRLEFQIDPWTVRVNGKKVTQLSTSQRLRVGVALQLAIAEITGVWFVAIDKADTLDARERAILQDVIEGWPGQIVVCATKDPGFELPTALPEGVGFYALELRADITHVAAA